MHDQLDRFGAGYRICLASMRRLVARAALRGSSSKAGGRYRCPLPHAGGRLSPHLYMDPTSIPIT